jgi:hypothetical protein
VNFNYLLSLVQMRFSAILCVLLGTMLAAMPVVADTVSFALNQDGCTGTCGTGPFATITLTESGTGSSAYVTVSEVLGTSERFAGTGAGDALEFNVAGNVTINLLTSNFGAVSGSDTASAFGTFYHAVTCLTCQGGKAGNPSGPLSFTVGSATGVTIASFLGNSGGYMFASDIVGSNGNTGNVGSVYTPNNNSGTNTGSVVSTPEPGTVALLLGGLLVSGALAFRSKNRIAVQ